MKIIQEYNNSYTVRLDPGEEFIKTLQDFCEKKGIYAGSLEAVGSAKELQLACYNLGRKEYEMKDFSEFVEILNVTGNVALKEGKVFVHAHGVFGRADMTTFGGHVNKCVISATAEVVLRAGEGEVKREFDETTGLYLLS
ncbi:MAG: hypothetical protein A2932_00420 [Candidatus Spechtbacteria bacterium RIFCSPLOWO2_01_FULL_46_10]|uniref:PPC domain-containing protein n=1 Tax=Candidatus Spechtbacteria bacterium RIFCSPLOWO2_01_FULL_46_10 TaxID=1802163 RepID=A0A1G2HFG2_9BACT|nr:MAG: hypothetical protein A2932_00420 [Candidatus Spechtbacteria bacterium RIFCSPLOWO2_01_FULL_46_10]